MTDYFHGLPQFRGLNACTFLLEDLTYSSVTAVAAPCFHFSHCGKPYLFTVLVTQRLTSVTWTPVNSQANKSKAIFVWSAHFFPVGAHLHSQQCGSEVALRIRLHAICVMRAVGEQQLVVYFLVLFSFVFLMHMNHTVSIIFIIFLSIVFIIIIFNRKHAPQCVHPSVSKVINILLLYY